MYLINQVGSSLPIFTIGMVLAVAPMDSYADEPHATPSGQVPVIQLADEPVPALQASPPQGELETLVVTAQKREEDARKVPISIIALDGEELRVRGVEGPQDLPQLSPGLVYDSMVGFSLMYIRGVGTDQFLPSGDSSVTSYIDGIYTPFAHVLAQDFGKIERVEILKGPQGTLFGRNSTGGAINVVTAKPSTYWTGELAAGTGNFDARKARGYLSGPLTDNLQLGLSVLHYDEDSYYNRPADSTGEPFPREQSSGAQLRLNWDVTDAMSLELAGWVTRMDGVSSAAASSEEVKPLFRALVQESPGRYQSDPDVAPHLKAANEMGYGQLSWSGSRFDLKLLGSHQAVTTDTRYDFESSPAPLVTFRPYDMGARITTGEIQLLSNTGSWLSDRLDWILGYYYFQGDDAGFRDVEFSVAQSLFGATIGAPISLLEQLTNALGLPLSLPDGINLHLDGLVDTRSHAGYLQSTWHASDALKLTLGGRYVNESRHLTQSTVAIQFADDTQSPPIRRFTPVQRDYHNFSPRVALAYEFNADLMLFASWQRGFKSGTFNVLNIFKEPDEVQPETITSWEVGIKGQAWNHALRYNAAAFINTIHDLQVLILSLQSSGAVTLENAPKTRIKGLDFDISVQPLRRHLPGLQVQLGAAFLDGEYLSYPDGSGFDEETGRFRSDMDFTGNDSVRTPELSALIGLNYSMELGGGPLDMGLNLYYNDGYYFDAQNAAEQPNYTSLNAQVSYLFQAWNLRVNLYGRNLTEELYYYNKFQTDFNTVGTQAPPRQFGAWLKWSF